MNDRKIYILGAGFSKTFGLPLASEFLLRLSEESENKMFIHRIDSTCRQFYPTFVSACKNYPNIEDFFNYNYSLTNYVRLWGDYSNKYVDNFISEFVFEIADYLNKKSRSLNSTHEYYLDKFCSKVNPGDVIITFNWDTILERFLEKKKKKISFLFVENSEDITILKLHGSIDWVKTMGIYSPDCKKLLVVKDYKEEESTNILRYDEDDFLSKMRIDKFEPYIIPPLAYKDEMVKPLGHIWGSAYSALCKIKTKVFVGYSFPQEDTLARILFSSYQSFSEDNMEKFMEEEIKIVINPDDKAEFYYKKYCGGQLTFWNTTFSTFVDSINHQTTLKLKLSEYSKILLSSTNQFIKDVASRIFSNELHAINLLEKKRIREYLSDNYDIDIDI
jgi:hypothetical protein